MTRSYIDKADAIRVLRAAVPQVGDAIRSIKAPGAIAVGKWTTTDVAAHLVDVAQDNLVIARGEGTRYQSPTEVEAINEQRLRARSERNPKMLADLYEENMAAYLDHVESLDGDPVIPWANFEIPVSTLLCADIGECYMHGWDITRAEGRDWRIDPYAAALAGKGLSPLTINYVDKDAAAGFTGTFELKLRGFWALHFVFTDGDLAIEEPNGRRVDARISADPVAFMLVGYGRVSQWGPMMRGKLVAYGRKPWLALKFGSMLRNP